MISTEVGQRIIRILYDQNTWWSTQTVPNTLSKPFKRRDFYFLNDKILEREITAIVGPRQIGKTTILYQLIEHLIKDKKVDPKRILYLSFDYPYLTTITEKPVNDIFEIYPTQILHESVQKLSDTIYVFLDEICKLKDWSRILKGWYDLKYPINFVVSDSSIADVLKGSSESLVGRIGPYTMLSMKFVDIVMYHEKDNNLDRLFNKVNWNLRDAFCISIKRSDPKTFYNEIRDAYTTLVPYEDKLKIHLQEYLLKDGYPELLDIEALTSCAEKLRTYLNLTLYKDIVRIFGVRDPKALEELVTLLADASSQRVNYDSLSKTLSIKSDTLKTYLNYLESIFIISRAEFYAKSRASRIRKQKKIYVTNVGLRNALIGALNEGLLRDDVELGKVAEILVHEHCKRLKFCLEPGFKPELFYWRTTQGEEVDIVVELFRKPVPIESKYSNNIRRRNLKGLYQFLKEYEESFGIVITKDRFDLRENIIYIPLWLFLLMC
ncbi:MAG: ATP-binding protein [Euryarchaeota archaeon]|nr:ATP-binding protein [Euryarchaeota archaeon]